jgi:hypothetical protein
MICEEEMMQFIKKIMPVSKKIDQHQERTILHDEEMRLLCHEATELCLRAIITHLYEFVQDNNSDACYEEWIKEVHPENCNGCKVDHRFYVKESDHRLIWNELMDKRNRKSLVVRPRRLKKLQSSLERNLQQQILGDGQDLGALRSSLTAYE